MIYTEDVHKGIVAINHSWMMATKLMYVILDASEVRSLELGPLQPRDDDTISRLSQFQRLDLAKNE